MEDKFENSSKPSEPSGSKTNSECEEAQESESTRNSGLLTSSQSTCMQQDGIHEFDDPQQSTSSASLKSRFPFVEPEPPKPAKTLEELHITPATKNALRIQEYVKGYRLSTFHADGSRGQARFLSRCTDDSDDGDDATIGNIRGYKASWENKEGLERAPGFGLNVALAVRERNKKTPSVITRFYIVENEIECMVMHQAGKLTVSMVGDPQGHRALAKALKNLGIKEVHIVFSNDAAGRTGAVQMANACRECGIKYVIVHSIPGKRGHTICDEWELQGFDRDKFLQWIEALPIAGDDTLAEWALDPEVGLPPEKFDGVPPYVLSTMEQLRNEPPPGFLLEGILPLNCLAMLSGRHSSGKSALALDIGMCIATGTDWHGHPVVQGPVLYIAAEGGGGIYKRVMAWLQEHGVADSKDFYLLRAALPLHEKVVQDRLIATFRQMNTGCGLILVDTLVLCSSGLDENMAGDMSQFMQALQPICRATGATVLLIHHDNKAGEYRGSTALAAGVDTHLGVTSADNAATVRLEVLKQKDHEPASPLVFRRQTVEVLDSNGVAMTSLVYRLDARRDSLLSPAERRVLQVLVDITTDQREAASEESEGLSSEADSIRSGATASEWEKACYESHTISQATFARARRRLLNTLNAVQCDHPGQRGARYVVLPEWRHLLATGSDDLCMPDSANEVDPDAQDDSDAVD